ncbi:helix-turn-helix domain-containing protein [Clostridium minihomine]|uniref:helix-turn-helix domain-containing protein n=1 Tax=Clostridium minihomine TaxID=2045012 RepID=UPI00101AE4F2|nr:helix-turn-helix transcriptional regulator [Clostridium minihomine]
MYESRKLLEKILKAIDEQGLTAKECLIKSQVNTSFLSDWKNGKIKSPPFDKIYRIAKQLNLSLDELTDDSCNKIESAHNDLSENELFLLNFFRGLPQLEQRIIIGKVSEMIYLKKNQEISKEEETEVLLDLCPDPNYTSQIRNRNRD